MESNFPNYPCYTFTYANESNQTIKERLKDITLKGFLKFLILVDSDKDHFPRIRLREEVCKRAFANFIKMRKLTQIQKTIESHVCIAINEIESWYLAGLELDTRSKLKLKEYRGNTEDITKEQFLDLFPKGLSRTEKYELSLRNFSRNHAMHNNDSFCEFWGYLSQRLSSRV